MAFHRLRSRLADTRALAQDDGSIKTAFAITQKIEGHKRSWHDFELNALTCEISAIPPPTEGGLSPERLALVDIDLETSKPLALAVGENEWTGSLVFSRLDHASLARVVSDFTLEHGTAFQSKCAYDVTIAVFGALPLRHRGTRAFDLTRMLGEPIKATTATEDYESNETTPLVCVALPTIWESSAAYWRDGVHNHSATAEWEQFVERQVERADQLARDQLESDELEMSALAREALKVMIHHARRSSGAMQQYIAANAAASAHSWAGERAIALVGALAPDSVCDDHPEACAAARVR